MMNKGNATPALLVIVTAFIIVIYGLLFVLTLQFDFSNRQIASERSLHIAEAGVNYYRWHLSQDPDDYQDGTGNPGPYVHDYEDPQGDVVGQFSLEIDPPSESSDVVTITSTGWTSDYPNITRTIRAQYGRITLTRYAFLHNSNLWFGNDITVNGPVFSNGGIRQDGTNNSTVQSAKETYTCGQESGCNNPEEKPGIWGNGKISELWEFPVNTIDFDSIKVNFPQMKQAAQDTGVYLPPSGDQGYHLVFRDNGTVDVFRVTGVDIVKGYSYEEECRNIKEIITSEAAIATYNLSNIDIMFIEDETWVEGIVNGTLTVAVARFPIGTYKPSIWIPEDLVYLEKNGDHRIGLVAEANIVMTRDVPDELEINGALLAQNGRIIRHHYGYFGCKSPGTDKIKKEFRLYGSLISNQKSYWNFSSGAKSPAAGFQKSILDYDSTNYRNPPPYFPTSGQFEFISWIEEKD